MDAWILETVFSFILSVPYQLITRQVGEDYLLCCFLACKNETIVVVITRIAHVASILLSVQHFHHVLASAFLIFILREWVAKGPSEKVINALWQHWNLLIAI